MSMLFGVLSTTMLVSVNMKTSVTEDFVCAGETLDSGAQ